MSKLTEEQLLILMEEDRIFQEETKKMEQQLKKRTLERDKIFQRYGISQQAYYYRVKKRKEGIKKREELRNKLEQS